MTDSAPFDARAFRQALGSFTTGVTIITTRDAAGQPIGLTANSFNSVSLDPPMVLWSLARSSRNLAAFQAAQHWAVHILSAEQEALSNRFAKSSEEKFAGVTIDAGIGAVPLLHGCTTRLQCKTSFQYEGGDHIIFVGEVLAFDRNDTPPLVFHSGSYAIAMRKPALNSDVLGASFGADFLGFLLSRAYFDLYARVRKLHEAQQLRDQEFFLLIHLLAREDHGEQSLRDINELFELTGRHVEEQHVQTLVRRGLVTLKSNPGAAAPLDITESGRVLGLHLLAAVKAIESEILDKLGTNEALSLKSLLKQLLQITDLGAPH